MLELTIHFLHAKMVSLITRVGVANQNAGFTSSCPLADAFVYKLRFFDFFKADTCSMATVTTTEERTLRL